MWQWIEGLRPHTSHVHPLGDLIEHDIDSDGDCVCVPCTEPVTGDGGGVSWMYIHASLDGRELTEGVQRG